MLDHATGVLLREEVVTVPPPVPSNVSGGHSQLSRADQLNVRLQTDVVRNGRPLRGRHFLGPISDYALTDGGLIASGTINAVTTAYAGILDVAGPLRLVVWGRPIPADADSPHAGSAGTFGHVQKVACAIRPGTLRGRKQ